MSKTLAIVNCSQIVTLSGPRRPRIGPEMCELSIITGGAMLVRHGLVEKIGPKNEIETMIDDHHVIDAGNRLVMPGFVDAHTHPVFAGNRAGEFEMRAAGRTYQEIAASGGGIRTTVKQTRDASEEQLVESGKRYAQWFLRTGTTTIEAKSGYGLTLEDELKMLRAIQRLNHETPLNYVPTFLGAHIVPDEFKGDSRKCVDQIVEEMLPAVARANLAKFCDVFCEGGAFDLVESRRILMAAKTHGLGLRIHADQLSLNGGAELAAELGAKTADHLEYSGEPQFSRLKSSSVQPVLLPASVLMLGLHRYPKARAMIDAGLAVVVATDFNPGSSPVPSMPLAMTLAVTQMKMAPAEAVTAGTINAAYSLGLGESIGSLEPGKKADFVIYDASDYRELTYFAGIELTRTVFINGQQVDL